MSGISRRAGGISGLMNMLFGDVALAHRFRVAMDDGDDVFELGEWQKASGLSVSWEPVMHKVGDMGSDFLLYSGNIKYSTIKLSRAVCFDTPNVQRWLARRSRQWEPMPGVIELVDWIGLAVVSWQMREIIPTGWSVNDFNASNADVAIETLEFAHTGFLDDQVSFIGIGGQDPRASNW